LEAENGSTVTFSQFKERVDRLSCGLQEWGVKKGDRIGIIAKNCLEYFILLSASAALGAIMLPVNWRLSSDEIGYIVNNAQLKLLFIDHESQELIRGMRVC
jgi:long-chain acyl-CoA synthetase